MLSEDRREVKYRFVLVLEQAIAQGFTAICAVFSRNEESPEGVPCKWGYALNGFDAPEGFVDIRVVLAFCQEHPRAGPSGPSLRENAIYNYEEYMWFKLRR